MLYSHSFALHFFGIGMKTDFSRPLATAEFSKFAGILSVVLSQHHLSGFKRRLLLGRKVMTNLDSIFKSRDITLLTKVFLVKAMVFPVVMYGCESWTIKKADRLRIDAFELWCWERLLKVHWTARGSNQSIQKETSPEYLLKGLMLRLKLQYFGYLMWRAGSFEKTQIGRASCRERV